MEIGRVGKSWEDYEMYGESEWSKKESWHNAYRDTPSKEECDRISAELSGEVKVYYFKKEKRTSN